MKHPIANTLRTTTAVVLSAFVLFTQFAHAARLPRALAQMAATAKPFAPAPIPSQIASAHTVFLVNQGADANFPGHTDEGYNALYASLQAWGHYQLVASPAQADLIFQLHAIAPITSVNGTDGNVSSYTTPEFQLTVVDQKTNTTLWTVTSPVNLSAKAKEHDRWFSLSVANLTSRIKVVTGETLSPTESAQLTEVPPTHYRRTGLILVGVFLGLAVGGSLLAWHEYNVNKPQVPFDLTCAGNKFFCTNP
jgi:hypothetical protein